MTYHPVQQTAAVQLELEAARLAARHHRPTRLPHYQALLKLNPLTILGRMRQGCSMQELLLWQRNDPAQTRSCHLQVAKARVNPRLLEVL